MSATDRLPANTTASSLAVLLAAGAGSRFDGTTHKLNARLGEQTVAAAAISSALMAGVGDVAVIVGATQLDDLPLGTDHDVRVIENPNWADGQATSLTTAVEYARSHGYTAIVVALADQPFIEPEAWRRVAASDAPIAYATYAGRIGHPIRLSARVWADLPTAGDEGARSLIRIRHEEAEALPCSGSAADIDTVEDLTSWQKHSSTNSPSTAPLTKPGR